MPRPQGGTPAPALHGAAQIAEQPRPTPPSPRPRAARDALREEPPGSTGVRRPAPPRALPPAGPAPSLGPPRPRPYLITRPPPPLPPPPPSGGEEEEEPRRGREEGVAVALRGSGGRRRRAGRPLCGWQQRAALRAPWRHVNVRASSGRPLLLIATRVPAQMRSSSRAAPTLSRRRTRREELRELTVRGRSGTLAPAGRSPTISGSRHVRREVRRSLERVPSRRGFFL